MLEVCRNNTTVMESWGGYGWSEVGAGSAADADPVSYKQMTWTLCGTFAFTFGTARQLMQTQFDIWSSYMIDPDLHHSVWLFFLLPKDIIDSSTFYERPMCLPLKDQHLLTISAPAMVEFEVQVTCCSQTDSWIVTPRYRRYRGIIRRGQWGQWIPRSHVLLLKPQGMGESPSLWRVSSATSLRSLADGATTFLTSNLEIWQS